MTVDEISGGGWREKGDRRKARFLFFIITINFLSVRQEMGMTSI
jgi:hypothetical protein